MQVQNVCLPPPERYTQPTFPVPAWACDSHCHVTPPDHLNVAPEASYIPAPASAEMLARMRAAIGLRRSVVVQASAYGQDNRAVEAVLRQQPEDVRGVVVTSASVSDGQLEQWHALGVRGARFIMSGQLGNTVGIEDLLKLAPRLAERDWHAEIMPNADQWTTLLPRLSALPCKLVVDHMGGIPAADKAANELGAIERLLEGGRAWLKLIGYRLSADLHDNRLAERAQRYYRLAPTRMVWGTDWPHVGLPEAWDAGELLNVFAGWFGHDAEVLHAILARNPEELFDFPRRAVIAPGWE